MNVKINMSLTEAVSELVNYYSQNYGSDAIEVTIDASKHEAIDSRKIHSILMLKWF